MPADGITARDLLNAAAAVLLVIAGGVLHYVWREIVAVRARVHLYGNWLTDHESYQVSKGKPPYDPPS